jgi:hypothetical protein
VDAIAREEGRDGRYHLRLRHEGPAVSWCEVVPLRLRYGAATLRVDGLGDVWTEPAHRRWGHARRVLTAAMHAMDGGDAALSLLYGIEDLYPKFGYATTGADYGLWLRELAGPDGMPEGWTVRPFVPGDLGVLRELYDAAARGSVGPTLRAEGDWVWERLAAQVEGDACRLAVDPGGRVAGYAWRGAGLNYVELAEGYFPRALVLAEAVADSPAAAAAVVALCRRWGREATRDGAPVTTVSVGAAPDGRVWRAAAFANADRVLYSWRCAGPMVRLLSARRFFAQAAPELTARAAGLGWRGVAAFVVGPERVHVAVAPDAVRLADPGDAPTVEIDLPAETLAGLAWGGFPPEDLLDTIARPLPGAAADLLRALFPRRWPYVFTADRP